MARTKTKKIIVGKTQFRFAFADSSPLWVVVEKRGRGTWLCEIVNEPEKINGKWYDSDFVGHQQAFLTEQIKSRI